MKRSAVVAGSLLLCAGLAACGSSASPGTTAAAPTSASSSMSMSMPMSTPAGTDGSSATATAGGITIKDFGYSGQLTVKAGATVTVTNMDSTAHTLTDKATKKFDTGNIAANGGTGTFVAPSTPGSYPFGCTYHPEMAGTLVVTS